MHNKITGNIHRVLTLDLFVKCQYRLIRYLMMFGNAYILSPHGYQWNYSSYTSLVISPWVPVELQILYQSCYLPMGTSGITSLIPVLLSPHGYQWNYNSYTSFVISPWVAVELQLLYQSCDLPMASSGITALIPPVLLSTWVAVELHYTSLVISPWVAVELRLLYQSCYLPIGSSGIDQLGS